MGIPSPPIEKFIHDQIVTDEEQWYIYSEIIKKHPNENDLANAREFTRNILEQID